MGTGKFTPFLVTDTIVTAGLLEKGDTSEPVSTTITLAAAAAKATTGSPSITVPSLATGVKIPANAFLTWETPTGGTILTQVSGVAVDGDTSIDVVSIPEEIPADSTALWPPEIQVRTGVSVDRSTTEVTYQTLKDVFENRIAVSVNSTLDFPGYYNPNDAGYANAEWAQMNPGYFVYVKIEYPASSPAYQTGKVVKGICSVTGAPLDGSSGGLIDANLQFGFAASPDILQQVPTAA